MMSLEFLKGADKCLNSFPHVKDLFMSFLCLPFFQATVFTTAIAFCFTLISALVHALALLVSSVLDKMMPSGQVQAYN
jgi:hypothetical protein